MLIYKNQIPPPKKTYVRKFSVYMVKLWMELNAIYYDTTLLVWNAYISKAKNIEYSKALNKRFQRIYYLCKT